MQKLTEEQLTVIDHPPGHHARVLAVAGSGKSTTLAYRIKYLIDDLGIAPNKIIVLMFNALARKQFYTYLDKVGLPQNLQPAVHTFHSFSFQVINQAIKIGLLPPKTTFWLSDQSEFVWLSLKRVITELEKTKKIPKDLVDPDQAMHAISLWKGSLVTPLDAVSSTHPFFPTIFAAFEQFRLSKHGLTYDDFVPTAVSLLTQNEELLHQICNQLEHLIVDEYQDVNLGQQSLIELLAGEKSDLMVVGDDDQTIYEWRGARPNFIIHDFNKVFNNKQVLDYRLSRSFRFGPIIAQCASNVIANNLNRVEKPLISFQVQKAGFIEIFNDASEATRELTSQVITLSQFDKVPAKEIIVLARMYCQMDSLEAKFLEREIPYQVVGQEPFFKRKEINTLLDYIRLTDLLNQTVTMENIKLLFSVANKPSRMLSRSVLEKISSIAIREQHTFAEMLNWATTTTYFEIAYWQAAAFRKLRDFLVLLDFKINKDKAGEVLEWMVEQLDYLKYFQTYYGNGEVTEEKSHVVLHFIEYVRKLKITPMELIDQFSNLDTTRGEPDENLIKFTTIFKTKGLEYDYVLMPQVDENLLPYLKGEQMDVFDTKGVMKQYQMSSSIENERRLFYVGLTRARKGVYIGTSSLPSRFLQEIQLQKTHPVMKLVQNIAYGNQDSVVSLSHHLQSNTFSPAFMNNIQQGYLQDLKINI